MELMRLSEAAKLVGQHVQSVREMSWERIDGFPAPVPLVGRKPAVRGVWFLGHEVREWIVKRAVRDAVAEVKGQKFMGRPTKGQAQAKRAQAKRRAKVKARQSVPVAPAA